MPMQRNMRALILGPPDKSYESVRETLAAMFREASVDSILIDAASQRGGALESNAVAEAIQEADLIVADVSGRHPSVLYELGFAHALRKPTVILLSTHAKGDLPFDIASYNIVTYDPANPSTLKRQMSRFLSYQASKLTE
jgi:nucleoside 2-deoxyribosyltransferase